MQSVKINFPLSVISRNFNYTVMNSNATPNTFDSIAKALQKVPNLLQRCDMYIKITKSILTNTGLSHP